MPFHVEISSAPNHARVFNMDVAELRRTILEPWLAGRTFELGEQEWEPRESKLTILEGPALDGPTSPSARAGRTRCAPPRT